MTGYNLRNIIQMLETSHPAEHPASHMDADTYGFKVVFQLKLNGKEKLMNIWRFNIS